MKQKYYFLETCFSFGKYEGKQVKEIIESDFPYLVWCAKKLDHFYLTTEVVETIKNLSPDSILGKVVHRNAVAQLDSDLLKIKIHQHSVFDMESIKNLIRDADKLCAIEELNNNINLDENDDEDDDEDDYEEASFEDPTDWSLYNDALDPDQQSLDFWNQF